MTVWRATLVILLLTATGCDDGGGADCASLMAETRPPADETQLTDLVQRVETGLYPELAELTLELRPLQSDSDFFNALVDPTTVAAAPNRRTYLLRFNPLLFERSPPANGVVAILAHELKHIVDYFGMDSQSLVAFAVDYATGDIAAYERSTDEHVLRLGCGEGLIAYRQWLYRQLDAQTVAQKRRDYYTPEEIEAWIARGGP
jgi:hypothetical protein